MSDKEDNTRKPHNHFDELTSAQREEWAKISAAKAEVKRQEDIGNAQKTFDEDKVSKVKFTAGDGNGKPNDTNGSPDPNPDDKERRSVADKLVDLVTQNSNSFFKDQYETPFALVYNKDHHEVVRIGSDKFKRYLGWLYYENENKAPNIEAVNSAIQVLHAKAEYKGDTIPLSLRVALYDGNIHYDLTNEKWQCIKITRDSWQVLNETTSPLFTRHNQIAQVQPDRNYEPEIFDKFIRLLNLKKEDDRILLKVYIISLFIPGIQHVILQIHGEQGGAKSMLETLIKELVDPSKAKLLSVHKDRMEFIQQLAHNYLAYYDNLKYTPSWLSDEVCRAVTGSGSSKRKLYSDDDDIVYQL